MGPKAAPQRLAQLGSLARNRPRASSASTRGSRSPPTRAASIARPQTPKMSVATKTLCGAGILQGLWIRWPPHCGPGSAACHGGADPTAPGSGPGHKLARSSPCSTAPPARPHQPRRSCGRAGSWSWRALTNSSSKPASSSTYQTGFQLLAGRLQHHLSDPLRRPTTQPAPPAPRSSPGTSAPPGSATAPSGCARRPPPRLGHIQPGAARHQQLHRRHLPVLLGGARQGRPIRRRCNACSQQQFVVPRRPPHQS